MLKLRALLFLLFFSSVALGNELPALRRQFLAAVESPAEAERLLDLLKPSQGQAPLLQAYRGAAEALMARHAWNPYYKMAYLRSSQRTLAGAIARDPSEPEMRFLRFSIQHYLPAWLGYSPNLDEDRKVILANLNRAEPEVRAVIVRFLLESKRCTAAEEKSLRQSLGA